jgi:dipeptidyl aminopeptidase/acylaminoacyl peptidase
MIGYGPSTSNLYLIDIASREKVALTSGAGQKRLPLWSPDGRWIAYVGGSQWRVPFIYVLPASGGKVRNVTGQLDRLIYGFLWSPDTTSLVVSYKDSVSVPIARIQITSGKIEKLTNVDAFCHPFAISRKGNVVWAESDPTSHGVIYIADGDGKNVRPLFDLNPQIKQWALGEQEVVRWKNTRGEEIEGILIKPVDYTKGRTYPVIVDPYPLQSNNFYGYPMVGNQAFASRGYAVFFPNERTPHTWQNPIKGEAYNEAVRGPLGIDIMMDDFTTGIDNLVALGIVDPERMCLYGFSNGGGAVNLILTKTSRFKCAVSASGAATDWALAFFLTGDSTFPDLIGGMTPWQRPDAYVTLSPIFHLDKINTPLLLAVGDEESIQLIMMAELYNGLRYAGKDVTLLRYPNEGHGFTGGALKDYWERVNAFFDKYLKPEHPPN